ncbi:MAG TPA: hypothetical protein DCY89_08750 [Gammaproteobacteria bacterium]|nr:hypothetical protein [Gammaproteobacteria bacterium]
MDFGIRGMGNTHFLSVIIVATAVGFAAGAWLGLRSADGPPANEVPVAMPVPAGSGAPAGEAAPQVSLAGRSVAAPGVPAAGETASAAAGQPLEDRVAGVVSVTAPALTLADIEALLGALPANERDTWLADAEALGRLVEEESALRSVLTAAEVNRALDDSLTALLVQRARDRTLVDLYLTRVVRANLSPDWPAEADIARLLREQPERFLLPERVPVWQIFLPLEEGAEAEGETAVLARAREFSSTLRKGKADFAVLAGQHSAHAASRSAGGYMGLLAVADLLPELRELLGRLPPGTVSEPVRSPQGFHIVRFGERLPERALPEAEAKPLARELLVRDATVAIREAALKKIRETHPVTVSADEVDAWHQALLSRDWSDGERDVGSAQATNGEQRPALDADAAGAWAQPSP